MKYELSKKHTPVRRLDVTYDLHDASPVTPRGMTGRKAFKPDACTVRISEWVRNDGTPDANLEAFARVDVAGPIVRNDGSLGVMRSSTSWSKGVSGKYINPAYDDVPDEYLPLVEDTLKQLYPLAVMPVRMDNER